MANDLIPNSFQRAAEKLQAARAAERTQGAVKIQPKTSAAKKARLNVIPDSDTLADMIDNALSALSRGVRWARGSILNLIV